ncbi:hypothetical protein WI94_18630 [Burkholderia vietnamiensis]|nr:hypothetical protein WI94_18630 [Burkholderia vietnamiensis]KVE87471.1 hypothetical protein WJ00_10550 [Burkholderia vietnamiensis]
MRRACRWSRAFVGSGRAMGRYRPNSFLTRINVEGRRLRETIARRAPRAHYAPITRLLRIHYAAIQPGSRRPTQSAACS